MWSDWPTPVGSDCLNMKTFVGRIVTVSDGGGRSVTVSNWGVVQSSRHRSYLRSAQAMLKRSPGGALTEL